MNQGDNSKDTVILYAMQKEDLEDALKIESESFLNPWTKKSYLEEISNPHSNNYVGKIDLNPIRKTIALISYRIILSDMELLKIAVDKDYRKTGVATYLLNLSLLDAKKKGALFSFLEVSEKNRAAVSFYEKNGYECYGKRKGYYRDSDAFLFKRKL